MAIFDASELDPEACMVCVCIDPHTVSLS